MNELILNSAQLLLKGTDRNLDVGTIFSVVITGLVVVFIGLILLILFVSIYGKIFETVQNRKAEKSKKKLENANPVPMVKSEQQPARQPVVEEGVNDEVVAVIAAAVAAMSAGTGKKMVLRSVSSAKPSRPLWAQAGIADNTRPF